MASRGAPVSPHRKGAQAPRRAPALSLDLVPIFFNSVGVTSTRATPELSARVSVLRVQGAEFGAAHSLPSAGGAAPKGGAAPSPAPGWSRPPGWGSPGRFSSTPE